MAGLLPPLLLGAVQRPDGSGPGGAWPSWLRRSGKPQSGLMSGHFHMVISIPPKYAASQVVGFVKGKRAIHWTRTYGEHRRNFVGQRFWARGYFVSAVGRDKEVIRNNVRNQEQEDKRLAQMNVRR